MSFDPVALGPDDLIRHARVMRGLALAVVRDGGAADDLVQDTWIAALRHPPADDRPMGPWLFEVVRNLARTRARSAGCRDRRQAEFVRLTAGDSPSPEEMLGRAEIHRQLAELVLALDEPLRATVLLRYYEGMSAADIARVQGIPPGTVRRRLKDALDGIRDKLDARHDGRRDAWSLLLLPFPRPDGAPTEAIVKGVLALKTASKTGAAVAVLLALFVVLGLVARGLIPHTGRSPVVSAEGGNPGLRAVPLFETDSPAAPAAGAGIAGIAAESDDKASRSPMLIRGGVTLSGHVRESSGGPLAGATVRAHGPGGTVRVIADDRGFYRIALPRQRCDLEAAASGYVSEARQVDLSADARVDLSLAPASGLRGRVVMRGSGEPVADALVILAGWYTPLFEPGRSRSYETRSDTEGWFDLRELQSGEFLLVARRGKLAGRLTRRLPIAMGARLSDVVIEVEGGFSISGRVRGPDGAGLPTAELSLGSSVLVPGVWPRATTDTSGAYRIDGILPGRYWLRAQSSGHVSDTREDLVLQSGDLRDVDFALARGAAVAGLVTTAAGDPVSDVTVTITEPRGKHARGSTQTAADGAFRVDDLALGEMIVEARHPTLGAAASDPFVLGAGGKAGLLLRLRAEPDGHVSGRVTWDDGAVAGPEISVVAVFGQRLESRSARVGPGGRYEIGPVPAGPVTISAMTGAYSSSSFERTTRYAHDFPDLRRLTLGPAQKLPDIDLVLPRMDGHLKGVVLAPDGKPIGGATVSMGPIGSGKRYSSFLIGIGEGRYQVASSADGTFELDDLPRGNVYFWVNHPDYPIESLTVPAGSKNVVVQLHACSLISGRVLDSRRHQVFAYQVSAQGGHPTGWAADIPDPLTGEFTLRVPAGTYEVTAFGRSLGNGSVKDVVVGNRAERRWLEIVLPAAPARGGTPN